MLTLIPVSLAQANEFVRQHHRHHKPVAGHKFSIGCSENGRLCAVAIVGRPVSRYLDDGFTLEVNRLCSDGTKNACSMERMLMQKLDDCQIVISELPGATAEWCKTHLPGVP